MKTIYTGETIDVMMSDDFTRYDCRLLVTIKGDCREYLDTSKLESYWEHLVGATFVSRQFSAE